ncbi:MAG: protein kinase [archaeon]|nr:protein kinase [archaeon]
MGIECCNRRTTHTHSQYETLSQNRQDSMDCMPSKQINQSMINIKSKGLMEEKIHSSNQYYYKMKEKPKEIKEGEEMKEKLREIFKVIKILNDVIEKPEDRKEIIDIIWKYKNIKKTTEEETFEALKKYFPKDSYEIKYLDELQKYKLLKDSPDFHIKLLKAMVFLQNQIEKKDLKDYEKEVMIDEDTYDLKKIKYFKSWNGKWDDPIIIFNFNNILLKEYNLDKEKCQMTHIAKIFDINKISQKVEISIEELKKDIYSEVNFLYFLRNDYFRKIRQFDVETGYEAEGNEKFYILYDVIDPKEDENQMEFKDNVTYDIEQVTNQKLSALKGNILRTKNDEDENLLKSIAFQILSGLEFMHSHELFHLNLSLENIFFVKGKIKIAGIGTDKYFYKYEECDKYERSDYYKKYSKIYNCNANCSHSDFWSLGVILFELVFDKKPFAISEEKKEEEEKDEKKEENKEEEKKKLTKEEEEKKKANQKKEKYSKIENECDKYLIANALKKEFQVDFSERNVLSQKGLDFIKRLLFIHEETEDLTAEDLKKDNWFTGFTLSKKE